MFGKRKPPGTEPTVPPEALAARMTPGLRAWHARDPLGVSAEVMRGSAKEGGMHKLETAAIFADILRPDPVPSYSIYELANAASAAFGHEHLGFALARDTVVKELRALADLFELMPKLTIEERREASRLIAENDADPSPSYSKLWQRLQPLNETCKARIARLMTEVSERERQFMAASDPNTKR